MDILTAGAVACGALGIFTGVVGTAKGGSASWLWATLSLLGIAVIFMGLGGDPRDSAFPFGRAPVLVAGIAFVAGGLLLGSNALAERGVIPATAAVRDILAAVVFTSFWAITVILARAGESAMWLFAGLTGVASVLIWAYAMRKLVRELGKGSEGGGDAS